MPTTKLYLSLYIINESGERILISPELSEIPLNVLIANIRKTKKIRKHITIYEDDHGEYVLLSKTRAKNVSMFESISQKRPI